MQAVGQRVGQPPGWAPGPGAGLARLLIDWGHLIGRDATAPAERLGGWMDWIDAIALQQALAAPEDDTPPDALSLQSAQDWADAAWDRLMSELKAGFNDPTLARESALPDPTAMPLQDALAPYRLHHSQQQRSMLARIGGLRERLRNRLMQGCGARLARLAALDAVFERALAERERRWLGGLPALLAQRAAQLQAADPAQWRARYWAEQQRALQAELDQRLQPLRGLIEALQDEARLQSPAAA